MLSASDNDAETANSHVDPRAAAVRRFGLLEYMWSKLLSFKAEAAERRLKAVSS